METEIISECLGAHLANGRTAAAQLEIYFTINLNSMIYATVRCQNAETLFMAASI